MASFPLFPSSLSEFVNLESEANLLTGDPGVPEIPNQYDYPAQTSTVAYETVQDAFKSSAGANGFSFPGVFGNGDTDSFEVQELRRQASSLNNEVSSLQQERANLTQIWGAYQQEILDLRRQEASLNETISKLQHEKNGLNQIWGANQQEILDLRGQVASLNKTVSRLERERNGLNQKLVAALEDKAKLSSSLNRAAEESRQEILVLNRQLTFASNRWLQSDLENHSLRQMNRTVLSELQRANDEISRLRNQLMSQGQLPFQMPIQPISQHETGALQPPEISVQPIVSEAQIFQPLQPVSTSSGLEIVEMSSSQNGPHTRAPSPDVEILETPPKSAKRALEELQNAHESEENKRAKTSRIYAGKLTLKLEAATRLLHTSPRGWSDSIKKLIDDINELREKAVLTREDYEEIDEDYKWIKSEIEKELKAAMLKRRAAANTSTRSNID